MKRTFILLVSLISSFNLFGKEEQSCLLKLETAKEIYASGEKIWFKSYLCQSNSINNDSKILHVDLCAEGFVASSRILYQDVLCWEGDIDIPDSLQTGVYILRAYTSRAGEPDLIFAHDPIIVLNRFGKNEKNELAKIKPSHKAITPSPATTNENKTIKVYAASSNVSSGQEIEFWIETDHKVANCGLSFVVRKTDVIASADSFHTNTFEFSTDYLTNDRKKVRQEDALTISGKVTNKANGEPFINGLILVSIPDTIPQLYYSETDKNGNFQISLDNLYGNQDIIIQTVDKENEYNITLDNFELPAPGIIPYYVPSWLEESEFSKLTLYRAVLQKAYGTSENAISENSKNRIPFYGKAYQSVNTADYFELNDFIEISRELLPFCRIRGNSEKRTLKLFDPEFNEFLTSPWLLIDGVPVFDLTNILPLGSTFVKRVETQPKFRCYGSLSLEGILSIFTKSGDFTDVPLPRNAIRTQMEMLYYPMEYSGNNPSAVASEPDFRDILYWKPELKMEKGIQNIRVKCSYETGNYIAIVRQLTDDGEVLESSFSFSVSSNL